MCKKLLRVDGNYTAGNSAARSQIRFEFFRCAAILGDVHNFHRLGRAASGNGAASGPRETGPDAMG
jgi:hypothetical protein